MNMPKRTTRHEIETDFGVFAVPASVAIVLNAAKVRADGELDRRTAAAWFLSRYLETANEIAKLAYSTGAQPVMPEAWEI